MLRFIDIQHIYHSSRNFTKTGDPRKSSCNVKHSLVVMFLTSQHSLVHAENRLAANPNDRQNRTDCKRGSQGWDNRKTFCDTFHGLETFLCSSVAFLDGITRQFGRHWHADTGTCNN